MLSPIVEQKAKRVSVLALECRRARGRKVGGGVPSTAFEFGKSAAQTFACPNVGAGTVPFNYGRK